MTLTSGYPRVRALERGLELIVALSELGWATPGELAKFTGIHRTTIYRLLHTLEASGYVHCKPGDGSYFLTQQFKYIADGIRDTDWVTQVVSPHMGRLLSQVQWPSDFAIFTSGQLIIKESTHRFSPMSIHRTMVGKSRPLLRSALGTAFLSAISDESREQVLSLAKLSAAEDEMRLPDGYQDLMQRIQQARVRGYAASTGGTQANISAIAYPVCWRKRVLGAINIIFFKSAMTPTQAAERYLDELHACVQGIEQELQEMPLTEYTGWNRRRDLSI